MDKAHMEYRKAELSGLESHEGNYNLKVIGINGTESKWLSITQDELGQIKGILTGDAVGAALAVLRNHGYAVKVFGPEAVHNMLDMYMEDNTSGTINTVTHRDEITRHIMEGDDWAGILGADDTTAYLWDVIEGTHNDHPEWFLEVKTEDPLEYEPTPDLVERYAAYRVVMAHTDSLSDSAAAQYMLIATELRKRGIIA